MARLADLVADAFRGELSLEEIQESIAKSDTRDEFAQMVLEDLQTAVEHAPGGGLTGQLDFGLWRESQEYTLLILDEVLIHSGLSARRKADLRQAADAEDLQDLKGVLGFLKGALGPDWSEEARREARGEREHPRGSAGQDEQIRHRD